MNSKIIISMGLAGCLLLNCTALAVTPTSKNGKTKPKTSVSSTMKKNSNKESNNSIKTLNVKENQEFSISLDQNASTGYGWSYKVNTDTIKLTSQKNIEDNPKQLVGAPSQGIWTFKAGTKGNYEMIFTYSRSWEKDKKAAKTLKYKIVVSAEDKNTSTQIPNPLVNYNTIDEARKAVGFMFAVPSALPDGYNMKDIVVISNDLTEIFYNKGNNSILYRTSKENADISGDYNIYENTKTITIGNAKVTCKGSKDSISLATWSEGGESFSLGFEEPTNEETLSAIIESIK